MSTVGGRRSVDGFRGFYLTAGVGLVRCIHNIIDETE
jgi:hypothetical protein